jgi:hypothetical protein
MLYEQLPINNPMEGIIHPLQEDQHIRRWFIGLGQRSMRPISVDETGVLKKRIFRLRIRPLWIIAAAIFVIPIFIVFLNSLHLQSDLLDSIRAILGLSILFLGLPTYILSTRDSIREAKALKGDLEIGSLFIFEGKIMPPLRRCKIIKHLNKELLIHADENIQQQFEILPNSETVLRVNGIMSERWRKGRILEATAPPEHHYDALVKEGLPEETTGESIDLFQRHMSHAELAELKRHIAHFKKPSGVLIAMATWMLLLIAAVFVSEGSFRAWQNGSRLQAVLVCILFAVAAARYIRSRRTARLLNEDAGMEILQIIKPQEPCEASANTRLAPVLEFLPNSLLGWNVDGMPYPWRLRKPRLRKT